MRTAVCVGDSFDWRPISETILEAATYKISVHYAFKIADHIIEKLKEEEAEGKMKE